MSTLYISFEILLEVCTIFTDRFIEIIQEKNLTAYKVAKETGISQGLMNEYKNGIKLPTVQNLVKIADCLDCSVDYLLGRTDIKEVGTNNNALSTNEAKMLSVYHQLSEDDQILVLGSLIQLQREQKEKASKLKVQKPDINAEPEFDENGRPYRTMVVAAKGGGLFLNRYSATDEEIEEAMEEDAFDSDYDDE